MMLPNRFRKCTEKVLQEMEIEEVRIRINKPLMFYDACNEYEIVIEDEEYYTKDAEEYNDKLNQYLEENIVTNIPYNSPIWIELCDDILE